jgi:hypothetical protein
MEKKKRFNFWIKLATASLDIISLIRLAFL